MAYNSRTEIDEKYLWDLTDMFADDAAFEAALERAQAYPPTRAASQNPPRGCSRSCSSTRRSTSR